MQINHNILFSFLSLFIYAPHNVPEWDLNPVLLDWGSAPYPLNHTPHRIPHLYFLPSFTTDPTTHLSANHITPCLPPSTNNPHSDWTHTDLTTHLSTNHITPFFFPPFTSNPHLWLDTHRPNHTSFNQSHYTTFSLHLPATHISDWTHTLPGHTLEGGIPYFPLLNGNSPYTPSEEAIPIAKRQGTLLNLSFAPGLQGAKFHLIDLF